MRFCTRVILLAVGCCTAISVGESFANAQAPANDISRLKPPAGELRGPAKNAPPIVVLTTRDPKIGQADVDYGMLLREVLRESFLLAARDELGLPTRDKTLREPFPGEATGNAARAPFELLVRAHAAHGAKITLFVRDGNKYRVLWDRFERLPKRDFVDHLVTRAEELSRTEFPKILNREGYQGKPRPFRKSAPVPPDVEQLLSQWSFLPQYAAIRRLHAEIQKNGSSPELLAGLSRGYANLSSLTEFHWSPAHKAYKARALLYAQRLVARNKRAPFGYWTRGYVRGLIGRHAQALLDFRAAELLAPRAPGAKAPAWVPIMKDYCAADFDKLNAVAENGELKSLARYLQMLAVEFTSSVNVRLKASGRVLETNPDCYRAIDMVSVTQSLGTKREGSNTGFRYLSKTLYDRIETVDDLPRDVKKLIAVQKKSDGDFADEIDNRMKLVRLLRTAGLKDRSEPSLAVLAQMIQEVSFVHAVRLLAYERNSLSVNADDTLATVAPLAEGHPFADWLQSFSSNRRTVIAALKRLKLSIDRTEMEPNEFTAVNGIFQTVGVRGGEHLVKYGHLHTDDLCREMQRRIPQTRQLAQRIALLKRLRDVSPNHPMTAAYSILLDWDAAAPKAAEWEKKHRNDAMVMLVLGHKYLTLKRYADSERVMKRHLEIAPDIQSYTNLAKLYYEQTKYDQWKQTLDTFLTLPSIGLEHARVQVLIAEHFMKQRQWQTALPYAEAAAGTAASWAMLCAAVCHERLGNLKKAEAYMRATSLRYRNLAWQWYFWCRRTKSGDIAAARKHTVAHFRTLGPSSPTDQLVSVGCFLILEKRPANARDAFYQAYARTHHLNLGLEAALLIPQDATEKKLSRELRGMRQIALKERSSKQANRAATQLVAQFEACLAAGKNGKLNLAAVDKILSAAPAEQMTDLWSFVGRFLLRRGDKKNAVKYLQLAATSPKSQFYAATIAAHELHKLNIPIAPRRAPEKHKGNKANNR